MEDDNGNDGQRWKMMIGGRRKTLAVVANEGGD